MPKRSPAPRGARTTLTRANRGALLRSTLNHLAVDHALSAIPLVSLSQREATNALGRVVTTADGRPLRSVITGRRRIVTGSYASRKAMRPMPHESMNELAFFHQCEVETAVVDYRAQPCRFEFVLDGKLRTYIADSIRVLSDGTVEIVELKGDLRPLRDADYALKLEGVEQLCDALGWTFRVLTRTQLTTPRVRYENYRRVQMNRHASHTAAHCHVALDVIDEAGGEVELGALARALGDPRRGVAIAMAMMVGRIVDIDLSKPVSSTSLVRAVSEPPHAQIKGGRL